MIAMIILFCIGLDILFLSSELGTYDRLLLVQHLYPILCVYICTMVLSF
jgi:hypothetical protein